MAKNTVVDQSKRLAELEAELAEQNKTITRLSMNQKGAKKPVELASGQVWTLEGRQALSINPMADPTESVKVNGQVVKDADGTIQKVRIEKKSGNPNGGLITITQCSPDGKMAQAVQLYWDQLYSLVTNADVQKATVDFLKKHVDIARTYQHKSSATVSFKDTAPASTKKYFIEHVEGLKASDLK